MPVARLEVFAVEDTSLQLTWGELPPGEVRFEAGGREVWVESDGRPGAVTIDGLPPGTKLDVTIAAAGLARRRVETLHTLQPPPGALLSRFATINDIHIGEKAFGFFRTMRDGTGGAEPYPLRCARAAIAEALEWGAQALFVKGDVTYAGTTHEWNVAGELLSSVPVPVAVVLGNHDVRRSAVDGRAALARFGIEIPDEPFARELPGIRVVLAHTAVRGLGRGHVKAAQRARIADLVEDADAAFVAMHHYPQRFRFRTMHPPGIPGPEAAPLLDAIADANPRTLVSSGHSHRHRRHRHGPLVVSEIGSTKDYPGAWAGYAVHEGGIRQVVRRVAAPDAIAWTDYTRLALLGLWGRWSPGFRSHRCFTHVWPG